MLTQLTIRNLGLIESVDLDLGPGLQVITGETGVGKSMLLSALEVLRGARARADWIRTGQDEARVAGFFELSKEMADRLEATHGLDDLDEGLRVDRRWRRKGRSRVLLNGEEHSLHVLREIGETLVQIHGQRAQLSLLTPTWPLDALDRYAGLLPKRAKYREEYVAARELAAELDADERAERERIDRRRFLEHVKEELATAELRTGERAEIERELEFLERRDQIFATIGRAIQGLNEREDDAIADEIGRFRRDLDAFSSIDPRIASSVASLDAASQHVEDAVRDLADLESDLDVDPSRLDVLRTRHDELQRLEERYRRSIDELCKYQAEVEEELSAIESLDEERPRREAELIDLGNKVQTLAAALTKGRKKASTKLGREIQASLADLAIEDAQLEFALSPLLKSSAPRPSNAASSREASPSETSPSPRAAVDAEFDRESAALAEAAEGAATRAGIDAHDERGADRAEIVFAANRGEPPRPLRDIASGGELSRVLLALESTLATVHETPTLVFDEVDTGVGGRLGREIGQKLQAIGERRQVLCVTHLPQVAGFGRDHFRVVKESNSKRTVTSVVRLVEEERVEELAAMLRGADRGKNSLAEARAMLKPSR